MEHLAANKVVQNQSHFVILKLMQMIKNKKLLEKEIFVDPKYCQETEKEREFLYITESQPTLKFQRKM